MNRRQQRGLSDITSGAVWVSLSCRQQGTVLCRAQPIAQQSMSACWPAPQSAVATLAHDGPAVQDSQGKPSLQQAGAVTLNIGWLCEDMQGRRACGAGRGGRQPEDAANMVQGVQANSPWQQAVRGDM